MFSGQYNDVYVNNILIQDWIKQLFSVLLAVLRFLHRVYESELLFITLIAMLDKCVSR